MHEKPRTPRQERTNSKVKYPKGLEGSTPSKAARPCGVTVDALECFNRFCDLCGASHQLRGEHNGRPTNRPSRTDPHPTAEAYKRSAQNREMKVQLLPPRFCRGVVYGNTLV